MIPKPLPLLISGLCIFLLCASLPPESGDDVVLFNLQRSRDADEIHYQLKLNDDGTLPATDPIDVNWVRYSTDGRMEPITWIQKELSFGLRYINLEDENAQFQFACCDQMTFHLRNDLGHYAVYTLVSDKLLELKRVYLQYNGGTQWLPNVEYAELYLVDLKTKKEVTEKIYP